MAKEELIASITRLNPSASSDFLISFSEDDLIAYLRRLQELSRPAKPPDSSPFALAG